VQPAKKTDPNPTARLAFKDTQSARGGYLAAQYLLPFIQQTPRSNKALENRLRAAGLLPPGMFVIPGKGAKLDRYGNLDLGLTEIVVDLADLIAIDQALDTWRDFAKRKELGYYRASVANLQSNNY